MLLSVEAVQIWRNKLNVEVCLSKCTSLNLMSVKTQLCKFSALALKRVCLPHACEHHYALGLRAKHSQIAVWHYFSAHVRFAVTLAYM